GQGGGGDAQRARLVTDAVVRVAGAGGGDGVGAHAAGSRHRAQGQPADRRCRVAVDQAAEGGGQGRQAAAVDHRLVIRADGQGGRGDRQSAGGIGDGVVRAS